MLKLEKITKDYVSGDSTVKALKGIDIEFRKNEFVSILGQSRLWKNNFVKYHRRVGSIYDRRFNYQWKIYQEIQR